MILMPNVIVDAPPLRLRTLPAQTCTTTVPVSEEAVQLHAKAIEIRFNRAAVFMVKPGALCRQEVLCSALTQRAMLLSGQALKRVWRAARRLARLQGPTLLER